MCVYIYIFFINLIERHIYIFFLMKRILKDPLFFFLTSFPLFFLFTPSSVSVSHRCATFFYFLLYVQGGQGGFEDVRRYVKQGGDFCKELASILHERYLDVFFRSLVIRTSEIFHERQIRKYMFQSRTGSYVCERTH